MSSGDTEKGTSEKYFHRNKMVHLVGITFDGLNNSLFKLILFHDNDSSIKSKIITEIFIVKKPACNYTHFSNLIFLTLENVSNTLDRAINAIFSTIAILYKWYSKIWHVFLFKSGKQCSVICHSEWDWYLIYYIIYICKQSSFARRYFQTQVWVSI